MKCFFSEENHFFLTLISSVNPFWNCIYYYGSLIPYQLPASSSCSQD